MNRQAKEHEVIVLGSGLGGLIAGALLAKKGHSVLLLKERGYDSSYQRNGYRFNLFSTFSERRLRPSLVQKISQRLGLVLDGSPRNHLESKRDRGRLHEKVPFQVILPQARVDLFDDPSLFQMEWKREFPDEFLQIETLYDELRLLQSLLKAKRKTEGSPFFPIESRPVIRKWLSFFSFLKGGSGLELDSFSKEFKEFLRLQLISLGSLFPDAFPTSVAAYLLLHEERGEWVSRLDLESLEGSIGDSFFQSKGEIEEIEKVENVEKEWKKGFTLTLEEDRGMFRTKFLILNSPLHSFSDLLGTERKLISRWLTKIRPRYLLFPWFLGIREKVVPVGMRDSLVSILDLEKTYGGGNVLFLALSPRGDETAAPEGRRGLIAQSLIPFERWEQTSLASHQESVTKHLKHVVPFLENHIDFSDFEWAGRQVGRWSYPGFLYETTGPFDWRAGVIPTRLSSDLYFVGKENFPYLGLEGEVLSGLLVADQVLKKCEQGKRRGAGGGGY